MLIFIWTATIFFFSVHHVNCEKDFNGCSLWIICIQRTLWIGTAHKLRSPIYAYIVLGLLNRCFAKWINVDREKSIGFAFIVAFQRKPLKWRKLCWTNQKFYSAFTFQSDKFGHSCLFLSLNWIKLIEIMFHWIHLAYSLRRHTNTLYTPAVAAFILHYFRFSQFYWSEPRMESKSWAKN